MNEIEERQKDEEDGRKWKELLDRVTAGRAPPPTTNPARETARRGGPSNRNSNKTKKMSNS